MQIDESDSTEIGPSGQRCKHLVFASGQGTKRNRATHKAVTTWNIFVAGPTAFPPSIDATRTVLKLLPLHNTKSQVS
jgi:hypothetical protein